MYSETDYIQLGHVRQWPSQPKDYREGGSEPGTGDCTRSTITGNRPVILPVIVERVQTGIDHIFALVTGVYHQQFFRKGFLKWIWYYDGNFQTGLMPLFPKSSVRSFPRTHDTWKERKGRERTGDYRRSQKELPNELPSEDPHGSDFLSPCREYLWDYLCHPDNPPICIYYSL